MRGWGGMTQPRARSQRVVPKDRFYNCVTVLCCLFTYASTLAAFIIYLGSFSTALNEYVSLEESKCQVILAGLLMGVKEQLVRWRGDRGQNFEGQEKRGRGSVRASRGTRNGGRTGGAAANGWAGGEAGLGLVGM